MDQTDQSNNFIIHNISLDYDIQFSFNELSIQKITWIIENNINQITFYFAEGSTGRGSEDIRKEFNVNQLNKLNQLDVTL